MACFREGSVKSAGVRTFPTHPRLPRGSGVVLHEGIELGSGCFEGDSLCQLCQSALHRYSLGEEFTCGPLGDPNQSLTWGIHTEVAWEDADDTWALPSITTVRPKDSRLSPNWLLPEGVAQNHHRVSGSRPSSGRKPRPRLTPTPKKEKNPAEAVAPLPRRGSPSTTIVKSSVA